MIHLSKPYIVSDAEKNAVIEVIESGMLASGPKVHELEEDFSNLSGVTHSMAVNNGTSALHIALHAAGIKPGDEVITTPFTFVATANSIQMAGATAVFSDVQEDSFNIDPELIESKITPKTKAIIAVNLYGQPADYERINEIAKKHNLKVIEDAAQSVGAQYKNKVSGSLADLATFSFYATKNVMCGEGGMVTTSNDEMARQARYFRNHGQDEKDRYNYHGLGYNYRLPDLLACIAIEQLKKLDEINSKRQHNAHLYDEGLKDVKGIITPKVLPDRTHVYHQYTIRVTDEFPMTRDELKAYLLEKEIQSNVYYPKPLYIFPHFNVSEADQKEFPITEKLHKEVLSIPVQPFLTEEEIQYIIDTIKSI